MNLTINSDTSLQQANMRVCARCGETKEITKFSINASARDGLRSSCKSCESIKNAAWRAANTEKIIANLARWRAANPEKVRAIDAKYRASHIEKVAAKNAKWQAANPDKIKAINAKWCAANPEYVRIKKQNRRARKRENGGVLSKGLAEKLFKLQRGKCACCGEPLGDDYHLDHITPLVLGGPNTDDNIQLLRSRCNLQKNAKHPIDFMQSKGFLL